MDELERLKRRYERERQARKQAEQIAEEKTREIYHANASLQQLNEHLEEAVEERTRELSLARDEAVEANQAKSQFLANMSHELRTPLNAIIGYSEMLMEEAADEGLDSFTADLQKIHSAGNHLLGLINDILDLSKIEAGKMDLYLETFDIQDMIEGVLVTIRPLVEKGGNNLVLELDDADGNMHADLTKVRQTLLNLLSNANKFTDKGDVTLSVRKTRNNGTDWIELAVSDTGIGMSNEQLGRLFHPFTQADASTTRKYGGTGLGLTITRRFCEMMNGDIGVTSEPGKGSTFTIRLPLNSTQPEATPETGIEAVLASLPEDACTILVVDDDSASRDLLSRFLTGEGYRVYTASSGEEGLEMAHRHRPHIITLDVMMPSMDGWTVLSHIKSDPELHDTPVVMLTMVDEKNLGYALGASDYLTKPIDRHRLSSVLDKYRCGNDYCRVMVVEDDAPTREMVARTLAKSGHEVIEAENGKIGLEQVAVTSPDLILLDLMMPVMDGFEFLANLRSHPEWRDIPVVVVTAKTLTEEDLTQLSGNVQNILQKGAYTRDQLLRQVRELVTGRCETCQPRKSA